MGIQCCRAARPARAAQGYNDGLSSESAAASEPRPQLSQEAAAAASFDKSELAPVTNQLLHEARAARVRRVSVTVVPFCFESPAYNMQHDICRNM